MILCIGPSPALDLTYRVPALTVGGTVRVREVTTRPGGKAVNVARVLHALGEPVELLLPLGGSTGDELASGLAQLGVGTRVIASRPTRRTVAVVADDTTTLLSEPAEIDCWPEFLAAAEDAVTSAGVVVVSGVDPIGMPAGGTARLVAVARAAGAEVVLDTAGPALLEALAERPTMVKPNAEELAAATGGGDVRAAARHLAERFGVTVVASLGPDGLHTVAADQAWAARPAASLPGNPTGAGDAVVAGLARGLLHGADLPRTLADCVALSAAAVLSPVAGEVDPAEVERQRRGARVVRLT